MASGTTDVLLIADATLAGQIGRIFQEPPLQQRALTVVDTLDRALEQAHSRPFAAVLCPLHLPGSPAPLAGEVISRQDLPVIVLCRAEQQEEAEEAVFAGAHDYLSMEDLSGAMLDHAIRTAAARSAGAAGRWRQDRRLRAILDGLPDHVFVKDVEGRYLDDNIAHMKFLGVTSLSEIMGKNSYDFHAPDLAERYAADDAQVIATGVPVIQRIEPIEDRHGQTIWLSTSKTPIFNAAGKVDGLVGVSRDVTNRVEYERRLAKANEELAENDRVLRQMMEALQKSHEELIQTQLQLIQAEKMDSVGRLAAGVAHEVKNPLAILLMGIEFLSTTLSVNDSGSAAALEAMRQAVRRADGIVRGLVDFSASRQLALVAGDLHHALEQSLLLVRHELVTHRISYAREFAVDLPSVCFDQAKIEQVFVNLMINAVHAMNKEGALTLRTYRRKIECEQDEARSCGKFKLGETVVFVEVDDTGKGIDPANATRLFDPFYTTKPIGKGTGLGLTVARKIVELHGGWIDLRNRPDGKGARVMVALPAAATMASPAQCDPDGMAPARNLAASDLGIVLA